MWTHFKRNRLRRRLGPPLIIVSGLPRSGTSMMMSMLREAGLPLVTDGERTADEDNPKGYFEDERVMRLDRALDKRWLRDCRGHVVKIISFLLKELPGELYYKVIFMRRDLDEVVASQNKMLERRGEPVDVSQDDRTLELYRSHLLKVDSLLAERLNFERLDIDYRQVLEAPLEQAREVGRFLGTDLDERRMAAVVDPELYRNRR